MFFPLENFLPLQASRGEKCGVTWVFHVLVRREQGSGRDEGGDINLYIYIWNL